MQHLEHLAHAEMKLQKKLFEAVPFASRGLHPEMQAVAGGIYGCYSVDGYMLLIVHSLIHDPDLHAMLPTEGNEEYSLPVNYTCVIFSVRLTSKVTNKRSLASIWVFRKRPLAAWRILSCIHQDELSLSFLFHPVQGSNLFDAHEICSHRYRGEKDENASTLRHRSNKDRGPSQRHTSSTPHTRSHFTYCISFQ